ncbi:hypothetical protein CEUSTIGMA_g7717.t1 [Chlamydomonas eustigma]|uniref:Protein kinase domain-containing protein n=1 Tax=Chlamydomonas eustigma TaxID=1157962 RepID=A0A250XBK4_9CHLO|nr:hypothetical protein CEUSTIGMA_g7717.t1 [Chlamydomonas eustigma]|eukprot:GAX80279.1 hypothetical protein CEUSTIGMA_g7717.t1 [Chlamydomonas eustigma]
MGCLSSKPDKYSADEDVVVTKDVLPEPKSGKVETPSVEQQQLPSSSDIKEPDLGIRPEVEQVLRSAVGYENTEQTGVIHLGSVRNSNTSHASGASGIPLSGSFLAGASKSLRGTPNKRLGVMGVDLGSIMDDHGMLNPMVSRQMSQLSRYSVRSESGSVMIMPEERDSQPFKLLKLIGRGGFGNVYLADWEEGQRVAVKIIQGYNNAEQPEEQEWEARKEKMAQMEAVLMSAIEHENIVRTLKVIAHKGEQVDPALAALEKQLLKNHLGSSLKETQLGAPSFEWHIIMEFCDKGSLSRALSTFMLHQPHDGLNVKWDAWASLEILKEITQSIMFLHQNRILHGDLKAANVLLASSALDRRKYIAKVADFGLSRVLQDDKNHIKTQTFGTVTHVPPELLSKGSLTTKADVYAIGVLMWELYTAEKVFKQLSDSEVILAVVTKKARPSFPPDVPSRYKFLAERCWADMVELRPSLAVIMTELENLQKNLCPQGPQSSPLVCRVYPSRQKALAELIQKQQAMLAQQSITRSHSNSNTNNLVMRPGSAREVGTNGQGGSSGGMVLPPGSPLGSPRALSAFRAKSQEQSPLGPFAANNSAFKQTGGGGSLSYRHMDPNAVNNAVHSALKATSSYQQLDSNAVNNALDDAALVSGSSTLNKKELAGGDVKGSDQAAQSSPLVEGTLVAAVAAAGSAAAAAAAAASPQVAGVRRQRGISFSLAGNEDLEGSGRGGTGGRGAGGSRPASPSGRRVSFACTVEGEGESSSPSSSSKNNMNMPRAKSFVGRRTSNSRQLSPLAPVNAGSPARVIQDLSVQRPIISSSTALVDLDCQFGSKSLGDAAPAEKMPRQPSNMLASTESNIV